MFRYLRYRISFYTDPDPVFLGYADQDPGGKIKFVQRSSINSFLLIFKLKVINVFDVHLKIMQLFFGFNITIFVIYLVKGNPPLEKIRNGAGYFDTFLAYLPT